MRFARDHDRPALGGCRAGDSLAGPHLRHSRHLLDARSERGAQHELVGGIVVEVDEARVGLEGLRHFPCDQLEDLVQPQGRVHGRDGLREEPKVPRGAIHD
jgi:hypothetical protein